MTSKHFRKDFADPIVDLLTADGILITVDPGRRVLRGSVAVTGDRISAIVPAGETPPPARRIIDASRHLVIPGLVNAHDHLRNLVLSAKEVGLLARTGTSVVHCPSNHMTLAKGITEVPRLLGHGIPVCLGLDGMDSMLLEVRLEVLMQSLAHLDPAVVRPDTALEMATLNGARACGGEKDFGSLEVGKKADVVTVAVGRLHSTPTLDPVHALVHMARAGDVDTVLVGGRAVVAGGQVQGIDEDALAAEVQKTARRYLERAGHGDLLPAYLP